MQKNKIYKYFLLTIGLIFIVNYKKKSKMQLLNFKEPVRLKLFVIISELQKLGLNDEQIKLALSQILLETGQFSTKSNVFKLNNNYSGIKFINKPHQIAVKGSPVPPSERIKNDPNSPLNFYAKFNTIGDWAKDYVRILNLRKNKPLQAANIDEFHKRLTENKYYDTSKPSNVNLYLKNLRYFYKNLV